MIYNVSKKLFKTLKQEGKLDDCIQWIITVPAIWNDAAKFKMKRWAHAAALKHVKIVLW